jgi:hypothetical protein
MGRRDCGVRQNGTEGLWCETEWAGGTLVGWIVTEELWSETEWDGGIVV